MGSSIHHLGYSRENLVGKFKPSKETLKSGVTIYYSDDGCQSYYMATIDNIFYKENKVYCSMHYNHHKDTHDATVDIEKVIENSLVEKEVLSKTEEKKKVLSKRSHRSAPTFEFVEDKFKHLCTFSIKLGFIRALHKLLNMLKHGSVLNAASPDRNAILIFDHYAKLKNRMPPFSNEEHIEERRISEYKKDFEDLVYMFNEHGPNYTIFYEEKICQFETEVWMSFQDKNPDLCFAAFANTYNVIRFINNVFFSYTKCPNYSFAAKIGVEKLVGIANLISDNLKHYVQDRDRDFNV